MADRALTYFHMPHTRSSVGLALVYELGAPITVEVMNRAAGENRAPAYLAVNPLGKVPALIDGDVIVTEQVAIFLHLADRFSYGVLAPTLDDPLRGAYLRWMVFYAASFEPALVDKATKHAPPESSAPYGTFDAMLATLVAQLTAGPYMLGHRFTAADILWASALGWTTKFGMVPHLPEIDAYMARVLDRPCFARVAEDDTRWIGEHMAAQAEATGRD